MNHGHPCRATLEVKSTGESGQQLAREPLPFSPAHLPELLRIKGAGHPYRSSRQLQFRMQPCTGSQPNQEVKAKSANPTPLEIGHPRLSDT